MQFYANSILDVLDRLKAIKAEDQAMRTALMLAGRLEPEVAYPFLAEGIKETNDAAPIAEAADAEGNAVAVKYDFSNATYDPERIEREIAEMLANSHIQQTTFETPYDD